MTKVKILLWAVGLGQLVLGLLYLFAPHAMLHWMGHSPVAEDIGYPLAMLSSRFLVYGVLLLVAARNPVAHRLLLQGMVGIQLLDLTAGIYFTASGVVGLQLSGFPMFNAALIALLLWLWLPRAERSAGIAAQVG